MRGRRWAFRVRALVGGGAVLLAAACGDSDSDAAQNERARPPDPVLSAAAEPGSVASPGPAAPSPDEGPWFVDVAAERGIDMLNRTGYPGKKETIMGGVGPGSAVLDANADGRWDLYVPNGNWLLGPQRLDLYDGEDRPRNALYIQQPDGSFRDEAAERGVDDDAWSFGCAAADLDSDGDWDLLVTNLGPNRYYLNDGTGQFTDVAWKNGFAGPTETGAWEWSTGIGIGDYDRDGILDLYVANYADLFKWLRESRDVERDNDGSIKNAAVCDWQRLRVYCGPKGLPGIQDRLYRGLGASEGVPRYEDVSEASGIWRPPGQSTGPLYGFQVLFTDLNNDGWPDIYVSNDSVPSFHFENRKDGTFAEVGNDYGIALGAHGDDMAGMGATVADLNEDGWLDLVKTNFSLQTNNLYVCEPWPDGRVTFRDLSMRTGVKQEVYTDLSWSALYWDYDHDGRRDIFFSCGHVYPEVDHPNAQGLNTSFHQFNRLFRNVTEYRSGQAARIRFVSVEKDLGPGFQVRECSRGGSLVDVDADGDLDMLVVNLNGRPNLLLNRLGSTKGNWLLIRPVGNPEKGVALEPIGARLKVTAGALVQHFEHHISYGFLSSHDPRVHVGLGSETGPVEVEVAWLGGRKTTHTIEQVNRVVEIRLP